MKLGSPYTTQRRTTRSQLKRITPSFKRTRKGQTRNIKESASPPSDNEVNTKKSKQGKTPPDELRKPEQSNEVATLEQVNKDMQQEIQTFKKTFLDEEKGEDVVETSSNDSTASINGHIASQPKSSSTSNVVSHSKDQNNNQQTTLSRFGFAVSPTPEINNKPQLQRKSDTLKCVTDNKTEDNNDNVVKKLFPAISQQPSSSSDNDDEFVSDINMRVVKVEVGTFERIDKGEKVYASEGAIATLPDAIVQQPVMDKSQILDTTQNNTNTVNKLESSFTSTQKSDEDCTQISDEFPRDNENEKIMDALEQASQERKLKNKSDAKENGSNSSSPRSSDSSSDDSDTSSSDSDSSSSSNSQKSSPQPSAKPATQIESTEESEETVHEDDSSKLLSERKQNDEQITPKQVVATQVGTSSSCTSREHQNQAESAMVDTNEVLEDSSRAQDLAKKVPKKRAPVIRQKLKDNGKQKRTKTPVKNQPPSFFQSSFFNFTPGETSHASSRNRNKIQNPYKNNQISEEEDDINTVASGETSVHMNKKDMDATVPPQFVRYRVSITLEQVDLIVNVGEQQKEIAPSERYTVIFKELSKFIHSFDSDALFVSWKNKPSFTVLAVSDTEFPEEMENIATYFEGFRAKLRSGYRNAFRFCLNTPKWNETWVEMKLVAWAQARSYQLMRCNIQAESSVTIGWLVYSLPFTNTTTLKAYMMNLTDYEWGFKLSAPTMSDKHLEWKKRTKALEVMVPSEKEESARQLISNCFSPYKKQASIKSFTDCYLFVANEQDNKTDNMVLIFSEMLLRHKFRLSTVQFEFVTSIIKDIDRKVQTKDKQLMSIREMILNLPTIMRQLKLPCNLFLSIDFVPNAENVWFNNVKGKGKSGYYITFYKWDAGEANLTVRGLGRYLAHYYGMDCVEPFFSPDHWDVTKQWVWNEKRNSFDTPEDRHMAANVLFDPTTEVMKAYNKQQAEIKAKEEKEKKTASSTTTKEASKSNKKSSKDSEVNKLGAKGDVNEENEVDFVQAEKIAADAKSVAMSLHSTIQSDSSTISDNNSQTTSEEDKEANEIDMDRMNQQYAMQIMQKEKDPDLDSLPEAHGKKHVINTIFPTEDKSIASSVTDLSEKSENKQYHNEEASLASAESLVSDTSMKSLQEADIDAMLEAGMTIDEVEQMALSSAEHIKRKAQQRADRLLALALRKRRLKEADSTKNNPSKSPGPPAVQPPSISNGDQSGSNCEAADLK